MKLLLHELNVASGESFAVVGETEFQSQQERHGGNRQVSKLAKQIARVLVLMGLESAAPRAMAMSTVPMLSDNLHENETEPQCEEPNTAGTGGVSSYHAWTVFLITMAICLLGLFSLENIQDGKRCV